jgi:2-dehydro-3-deoxyglucarate aldolase/4-hydroxy-2-oxoheptanedioate aldolase
MRANSVKARLQAGGHAFGTLVFEFFTPGMAQIMAAAGAEFALFDTEHSGVGIETIKAQMSYARFTSCTPMVRVPGLSYPAIAAALDAGALGIMVPMVESAEAAAEFVACTRYPPAGRRGAAFGVAHDDYAGGSVADKIAAANARTLVIAMIETAPGVAQVEQIAAVPGVDVLWLGHFDLTNSLGIPGQFEHPDYLDAVSRIVAAAGRNGLALGMMAADAAWAERYLGMGFRMIAYGLDHQVFQSALARGIDAMKGMVR